MRRMTVATRKNKLSGITKMINQKTVVKGSHLTVITHENGKTELVWDDDALLREVQEAMRSFEQPKKKVSSKK